MKTFKLFIITFHTLVQGMEGNPHPNEPKLQPGILYTIAICSGAVYYLNINYHMTVLLEYYKGVCFIRVF